MKVVLLLLLNTLACLLSSAVRVDIPGFGKSLLLINIIPFIDQY